MLWPLPTESISKLEAVYGRHPAHDQADQARELSLRVDALEVRGWVNDNSRHLDRWPVRGYSIADGDSGLKEVMVQPLPAVSDPDALVAYRHEDD